MQVKEHYDNHLGNFYSWMMGNFKEKQREQEKFFVEQNIIPQSNKLAIDLGSGHGIQSVSLARLGFAVKAVDFNLQLLNELKQNTADLSVEPVQDDFLNFFRNFSGLAEAIVCMGDTITHLESLAQIEVLINEISNHLDQKGKVVFSFRDLTTELKDEHRFITVRSDENRILTCFLEYFPGYVKVHDILYEKQDEKWNEKISAYPKLRLDEGIIIRILTNYSIKVIYAQLINRMVYVIGEKIS